MYDNLSAVPAAPKKRRKLPPLAIAGVAAVAVVGAALVVRSTGVAPVGVPLVGKDSGVAICEAIRDKKFRNSEKPGEKMTAEEYQQMRRAFADSRYAAIRDNGTKLVDAMWQISQLSDDEALAALPMLGTIMEAYSGLAGGCAEQGIVIPPLQSASS